MNIALDPLTTFLGTHFATWLRVVQSATVHRPMVASSAGHTVQELAKYTTITALQPQGAVIECLEGCVWITLDGDARDVVIEAGQVFRADRNSRALIHALEASRVRVARAVC